MSADRRRYAPPRAMLPSPEELSRRGRLHPQQLACLRYARHVAGCDTCAAHPIWHRPDGEPGPEPCAEGARLLRRWDATLTRSDAVALAATTAAAQEAAR